MGKEIERKFLVDLNQWDFKGTPVQMKQAYLFIEDDKVVRVRIAGEKAFLTIKGNRDGISRDEFEYQIPVSDATQLMKMAVGASIEKTRYLLKIGDHTWEIDVFEGENSGLIIAEIELEFEDEPFEKPNWILDEVSTDSRYFNFNLTKLPYSKWQ